MKILLVALAALLLAACAPSSDLIDQGPPPAEPPQAVVVLRLGNPPATAVATVFADLRGQFILPVHFASAPDVLAEGPLPAMPELIRKLRADQPLTTVVVAVVDRPLPKGSIRSPRHAAVSIAQRVLVVSTADLSFTRGGDGANQASKIVLHMFGHVFGLAHAPATGNGLMVDWRDDPGRLKHLADDYDQRSLSQLERWLKSAQTPPVNLDANPR